MMPSLDLIQWIHKLLLYLQDAGIIFSWEENTQKLSNEKQKVVVEELQRLFKELQQVIQDFKEETSPPIVPDFEEETTSPQTIQNFKKEKISPGNSLPTRNTGNLNGDNAGCGNGGASPSETRDDDVQDNSSLPEIEDCPSDANEGPEQKVKKEVTFICKRSGCHASFCNKSNLTRHLKEKHPKWANKGPPIVCDVCGRHFSQKVTLQAHAAQHSGIRPYECEICGKKYVLKCKLNAHLLVHRSSRFECPVCNKSFGHPDTMKKHSKLHRIEGFTHCTRCAKTFPKKSLYDDHLKIDADAPFSCGDCRMSFRRQCNLNVHKCTNAAHAIKVCNVCGKAFSKRCVYSKHLKTHTNRREFLCDICGKSMVSQYSLQQHTQRHKLLELREKDVPIEILKPHQCDVCFIRFSFKSKLNQHVKKHQEPPKHECEICHKKFFRVDSYKEHCFLHTGQKPFTCEYCHRNFATKKNLNSHLLTHDRKLFNCDQCDKSFFQQTSLKEHKKVHAGIYRFSCDVCKRKFNKKDMYESHVMRHTGAKPFQCEQCAKSYADKKRLREHMRKVHAVCFTANKNNFSCPHCPQLFKASKQLQKHMKTEHTIPSQQQQQPYFMQPASLQHPNEISIITLAPAFSDVDLHTNVAYSSGC